MKTKHSLPLLLGMAALIAAPSSGRGQENTPPPPPPDAKEDVRKPEAPPEQNPDERGPDRGPQRGPDRGPRRGGPGGPGPDSRRSPEMKSTPFVGLMTRELPPEVAAQAGVQEGFGLLVEEVMDDSPAKTAGIQKHDVVVMFNDQRIVNRDQLSTLVRAEGKDKEVTLTIRRAGQDQKISIKIGERMMPADLRRDDFHVGFQDVWPFMNDMRGMSEHWRKQADHFRDQGNRFRGNLEEYQDRLKDWMRGPKDRPMPEPPSFDGNNRPKDGPPDGPRSEGRSESRSESRTETRGPDGKVERSEIRSQSKALSRRDESGEYRLSLNDDGQYFIAHPKDGEEQKFSIATPEDRQKVPEQFRGKLEELERMSKEVPAPPSPPRQEGASPRPPGDKDSI